MASVEGIWFCPNVMGDSLELTALNDGGLLFQMVRQRLRPRGQSLRLDPCTNGHWEAENQIRLRSSGKALFLRHHQNGKWGSEVQLFRTGLSATGSFFRGAFRRDTHQEDDVVIRRETSTLFKIEKVDIESRFVKRDCSIDCDFNTTQCVWNRSMECKICMTNAADIVLIPCGHSGLCAECLRTMMAKDSCASCPFCRQTIKTVANIDNTVSQAILTSDDIKPASMLKEAKPRRLAWS